MNPASLEIGHVGGPWYVLVLGLAAAGGAVLLGGGLAAFLQRRSRPYLLVALALGTLLARTALAVGATWGAVGEEVHHFGEHVLDVAMAGLVIAAVVYARRAGGTTT
ncbi:hypothetical protein HUG10_18930 (plasmid) [Halorarum halophilum]|uniref:Uncharacterized protein n=1 Tax=Halorarum halophilum TaxID=2743090 RepID=A0A7D5L318_9EURY|nr:hypothetical protein [Halobaculum halophilum]QLG29683.1 hypothetical protein HUG10_18930 [Halobaculum halophilum]